MDLLFLLTIGDKVKSSTRNRLKLVREFELLIDYKEEDNHYNNFILNKSDDSLFNQFIKMIERRANKCKDIKKKFNISNIESFLNNWCEKNYYI